VQLAIDDFGTGYSSLNYLRRLPVDVVKIDRSFVAELGWDGPEHTIIAGIIGLTIGLGLEVVAEGIETQEQAQALLDLGCRRGQGFLYSPARELEDAARIARYQDLNLARLPVPPRSRARDATCGACPCPSCAGRRRTASSRTRRGCRAPRC
jgi:EAL domain-containing protein (putative c-di-GMP-specific phosphodiesterase class I)